MNIFKLFNKNNKKNKRFFIFETDIFCKKNNNYGLFQYKLY